MVTIVDREYSNYFTLGLLALIAAVLARKLPNKEGPSLLGKYPDAIEAKSFDAS